MTSAPPLETLVRTLHTHDAGMYMQAGFVAIQLLMDRYIIMRSEEQAQTRGAGAPPFAYTCRVRAHVRLAPCVRTAHHSDLCPDSHLQGARRA